MYADTKMIREKRKAKHMSTAPDAVRDDHHRDTEIAEKEVCFYLPVRERPTNEPSAGRRQGYT